MRLLLWLKKELLHILPIFIFFLVSFTLINWLEAFLFEHMGVTPFRFAEVAIAAALIAKVVLVVDHWTLINRYRNKPLIYPILWKTAFYWVILLVVRLLIRLVPFLVGARDHFEWGWDRFLSHMNWNLFTSVQFYYLLLLFVFVTFQELTFKLGASKMRKLFFG